MLAGADNWATIGIPSFIITEKCVSLSTAYNYMDGIAFYPNPAPFQSSTISQLGYISNGSIESVSSDATGQRGFRPRIARGYDGYISPTQTSPNTWTTYLYYNDAQIDNNNTDNSCVTAGAPRYVNWGGTTQRISVTQLTITEN